MTPLPQASSATGCVLGNPNSTNHVYLPSPTQQHINGAVAESKGPTKLGLKLLSVLFTRDEISSGICTVGSDSGKTVLDQYKIEGIRLHVNHIYPMETPEEEKKRWHGLLHGNLNNKCRNTRNNKKKE